ncbi:hypothetical protein GF312_01765, partial [Candidatus Poribacteria bacterium]|nr:hypothetical protein [Candidatus Poribacteria bacterium]
MLDFTDRKELRKYLKDNNVKDVVAVDQLLKKMAGMMIEELLEAERDEHQGYDKYDTKPVFNTPLNPIQVLQVPDKHQDVANPKPELSHSETGLKAQSASSN